MNDDLGPIETVRLPRLQWLDIIAALDEAIREGTDLQTGALTATAQDFKAAQEAIQAQL